MFKPGLLAVFVIGIVATEWGVLLTGCAIGMWRPMDCLVLLLSYLEV